MGREGPALNKEKGPSGWQGQDGSTDEASSITSPIAGTGGSTAKAPGPRTEPLPSGCWPHGSPSVGGSRAPLAPTFDVMARWYLDDYGVRRLRTLDTARGRVANLTAAFGGWPATAITIDAIRDYQRTRRAAGAAAATGSGRGGGDGQPRDLGAEPHCSSSRSAVAS